MTSSWQDNLTLVESLDYMLTNKVDCDVSFKLGKAGSDIVPAHKFVLAMRSSVFRAMLFGPLAEKDGVVGIPDLESDTFTCFLQYLYTDQCSITADNVMALMYAANKYNIGQLVKKCDQFMRNNLSKSNVCTIMEAAHLYDNQDLHQVCLKFIENHSEVIMKEKLLSDLGQECLGHVLRSDNLKASEEDIFTAVLSWADRRCTEKDLEVSGTNRRQVLGDLLYLLRFPLMSQETFVSISETNDGILSPQEQIDMFRGYVKGDFSKSQFSPRKRSECKMSKISTCYRFKQVETVGSWGYSAGKVDALKFKVSEPVTITGLVLFGCKVGSTTYNVHMEIVTLGQTVKTTVTSTSTEKTFEVLFSNPVKVQRNTNYTLKVCLTNGTNSYCGNNGISEVRCDDILFSFSSSDLSENQTSVSGGQIFGIKFYRN